ncbi:hypothetical protein TUM20985_36160 [Mycobacterium antarcticum]|uniref:DUF1214 domain-containing protein n=1 Tax=Mycolicibacterium sp. TUM20985 TaxID=3023370 RepID=UPI0025722D10|nr:DUF1214 domain-containing protein [Mycolicibacterium sp. TUM20985]BDX33069.1 hypothetical protein TUM20985_36160 [Mycolicibacterium sp. TUM20985]
MTPDLAPKTLEAWRFVQKMLHDVTSMVLDDARDEREVLDGLRVVSRVTALCSELSIEADPELPWFFDMCSPTRMVGGPNPDGRYLLAMIRGDRRYRITGTRGSTAYLGMQVLAGTGMTPRRMAAYLSDTELTLDAGGFTVVVSADQPPAAELVNAQWLRIPDDAASMVVREYVGDADTEVPATLRIETLDAVVPQPPTDAAVAEQFTAMAWTLMKLTSLHRTVKPELLTRPNVLLTAEAADLGAADTTPDNLYMIGTFGLQDGETLLLEFHPPDTRYWNVTLENIWHECIEPRRRHSSVTNRGVSADADGKVRIAIGARDFGHGHWLDTGGHRRGFIVLRWLDNPAAPDVTVSVIQA